MRLLGTRTILGSAHLANALPAKKRDRMQTALSMVTARPG